MDTTKLRTALESIPRGRWTSYLDLATAIGASPQTARHLNQALIRHELPNGHRVLKGDGSVAPTALGEPEAVRARLVAEGVPFEGARVPAELRFKPPVVPDVDEEEPPPPPTPAPPAPTPAAAPVAQGEPDDVAA